jgi:hypothetical protein
MNVYVKKNPDLNPDPNPRSGSELETSQFFLFTKIFTQSHLQDCSPSTLLLGYILCVHTLLSVYSVPTPCL